MKVIKKLDKKPESEIMQEYRKLTGFSGDKLTEEKLNKGAVTEMAMRRGLVESDIRHMLLTEDTFAQTLEREVRQRQAKIDAEASVSEIVKALNKYTKINKRQNVAEEDGDYYSIMIEGTAGIGKTYIVKQWCKDNNMNLFAIDLTSIPVELFGGLAYPGKEDEFGSRFTERLPGIELYKALSVPNTVLFLDEYNMGSPEVLRAMYNLALDHTLKFPIGQEKTFEKFGKIVAPGVLWFPTLAIIVASQNPARGYNRDELDPASVRRFVQVQHTPNQQGQLIAINRDLDDMEEKYRKIGDEEGLAIIPGQRNLARAILNNPHFVYETQPADDDGTSKSQLFLNPAALKRAIFASDGTKDDFLDGADSHVGVKGKEKLEDILADYEDVDDKANQALGLNGEEPRGFAKEETNIDKFTKGAQKAFPGFKFNN